MSKLIALKIDAMIESQPLGAVPGGTRVDLTYVEDGSKIEIPSHWSDASRLPDLTGRIIAGHDWALLREDAVIVFDGKVTFEITVPANRDVGWSTPLLVPLLAEIEGRMDLRDVRGASGPGRPYQKKAPSEILRAWKRGDLTGCKLAVGVFVEFTVDRGTAQGQALLNLERTTFFGKGSYTFGEPRGHIELKCVRAIDISLPITPNATSKPTAEHASTTTELAAPTPQESHRNGHSDTMGEHNATPA